MPGELFGTSGAGRSSYRRSSSALLVSLTLHAVVLIALVVVPLMAVGALPSVNQSIGEVLLAKPLSPEPVLVRPAPPLASPRVERSKVPFEAAPVEAPREIGRESLLPPPTSTVRAGVEGTVLRDVVQPIRTSAVPAPPRLAPSEAVRTGGSVRRPQRLVSVDPIYPAIAQSARVSGTVYIDAVIDTKGRVTKAQVLRGHPLLAQAALDAVKKWRYTPTLLNGVPVPVIMTVTVRFALNHR
ncbi:MAG: TonB family protein [Vicinamibacteraceae bacterium]